MLQPPPWPLGCILEPQGLLLNESWCCMQAAEADSDEEEEGQPQQQQQQQ